MEELAAEHRNQWKAAEIKLLTEDEWLRSLSRRKKEQSLQRVFLN
jgi:hypothetical protein